MAVSTRKHERSSFFSSIKKFIFRDKRTTYITFCIFAAFILLLVFVIGTHTASTRKSRIIDLRMENIGELSTQAAYFSNVQVISDSRELWGLTIPFTQSKYIFSYDGVIKAGINFKDVAHFINHTDKTITITLPPTYITSVSVDEDSLEIYDESRNIFTPLKLEDIRESRLLMEAEAVEQSKNNGLLSEAANNAKVLIQAFIFSNEAFADYSIIWNETEVQE
ncbi:MAG: DUF4230 domain-containing protein [Clostridia bacterium]|nr:DUF4230 domain-containing protein [Clostridia bacterium]